MEEMIYDYNYEECKVLHSGVFEDRKFFILSLGTHPTAYVELRPEEVAKSDNYFNYNLDVHCGFTYLADLSHITKDEKTIYIGWDYAHFGDYVPRASLVSLLNFGENNEQLILGEKQWTTEEIFEEVKSVIRQLNTAKWYKCENGEWILEVEDVEN